MIPVFDSNIIIDISKGHRQALEELRSYSKVAISIMTWAEVMSGKMDATEEKKMEEALLDFELVYADLPIARLAARMRRLHRMKLPDAIIWATAQSRHTLLVTRNAKDFPKGDPAIRIPYEI